ncbi:MAG: tetratricopeptide repeat protein [Blastocatellia bacterium]
MRQAKMKQPAENPGTPAPRLLSGAFMLVCALAMPAWAQSAPSPLPLPDPSLSKSPVEALNQMPLNGADRAAFNEAMRRREYTRAETILVQAIDAELKLDPKSKRAAQMLAVAGGVFFLNGEWMNAAIAFKKAEAIQPLREQDRFTLSMAYIRLDRRDWAKADLAGLASDFPQNALYLYWLARIDYDAKQYQDAIAKLEKVVVLDPQMMRAFDNLGLCYDYLGQYDYAVRQYQRAVELNRKQPQPSPWPHLNLAITFLAQNKFAEADASLREAIRYDARLALAHYHLGLALEKQLRISDAIQSLEHAAHLDPAYPETHYSLGLLYQKQGDKAKAREAFARFQQLKQSRPR